MVRRGLSAPGRVRVRGLEEDNIHTMDGAPGRVWGRDFVSADKVSGGRGPARAGGRESIDDFRSVDVIGGGCGRAVP